MSKCLIVRYNTILTSEKEVNIWCYAFLNSMEKGEGGERGAGKCIFDTRIFLPQGTGANIWWYNILTPNKEVKLDAIIHLPLCKGVTISCYNIITHRGIKFIAGVNISQFIFSPRGGYVMGVKIKSHTGSYLADRTSPSPPTVHQLPWLALLELRFIHLNVKYLG